MWRFPATLGLLSSSNGRAGHCHNLQIPSKVPIKLKQDICEELRKDPTKTAKELQQGDSIGYSPCQFAPAAAYNGTWISIRSIDEKDRQIADNVDFDIENVESSSPYRRLFSFGDEIDIVVLATPQMVQVLADSMFVQVDVTYPGLTALKYLMDFVAYNELTMSFQVVGRVLMNRVNKLAYKTAFTELFKVATETFSEFENGLSVNSWVVDFSLAQRREYSRILGEKSGEHIRRLQVHF
ncbi:hypothetical protein DAPPUDRAFT_333682 [Daphnia pulex]|uniref:Uncharacterized protein n=1 Tax=Daphnia pulex TaxID=6669 RepID=E9HTJ6_DAPPU|nr:hypothetical protein DAPPUDRAFT_333682 [Daphnia pulex]|eukprot:EFX64937.1 hypothetical protein DAPPUDRAFT_333682 [Daphnia pulex]